MGATTQPHDERLLTKPDCSLAFTKNRPSELPASYPYLIHIQIGFRNIRLLFLLRKIRSVPRKVHVIKVKNTELQAQFCWIKYNSTSYISIKMSLEKLLFSACECSLFHALKCPDFSRYKSEVRVQHWTFIKMLSSYYSTLKETQYHMCVWSLCAIFMKYEALATRKDS